MSAIDYDAIRARVEAATEEPWSHYYSNQCCRLGECIVDEFGYGVHNAGITNGDAEFIAHARQDIPDLLAAIDRVRELHAPINDTAATFAGRVEVTYCAICSPRFEDQRDGYPCPTIKALGG